MRRIIITAILTAAVCFGIVAVQGQAASTRASWHVFYAHPPAKVIFDEGDLFCVEVKNSSGVGVNIACGNYSDANGPYVRISATRIVIAGTNQRILFSVKRDR